MILGTVRHTPNGITASIHWDLRSTLATRRYMCGLEPPNYPMPAIRLAVSLRSGAIYDATHKQWVDL